MEFLKKAKSFISSNPKLFPLISIIIGLVSGGIVLLLAGYNPFQAYGVILWGIFGKVSYLSYTIVKATPLILTGLSITFAFRTGLFNIGSEGQFIMGTIVAAIFGSMFSMPIYLHIPFILIMTIAITGLFGAVIGFLKARFGVHEVITSIMMNWIALYLRNYFVRVSWLAKPNSEQTKFIFDSAVITFFDKFKMSNEGIEWLRHHPFCKELLRAPTNAGILIAIVAVIVVYLILNKTTLGYRLKAVGFNPDAAKYGGINVNKSFVTSMFIAGSLSGLAGALQVMAVSHNISILSVMEGYGFDGIAVALIGGSTALGNLWAGIFFGALKYGGTKLQPMMGAPFEIINIMIGVIVFFVAMPKVIPYLISLFDKKGEKNAK